MSDGTGGGGAVPVWVSGQQLWVRGLDRRTTCADVIAALLGRPDNGYELVERWRRVERPLGGDTRLLKLWSAWGTEQRDVRLTLRRVTGDDDSGRGSPTSVGRRRRCKRSKHQSQTVHPRRLAQLSKSQNIERLLKLILVQGETIHQQLRRLHDRDGQIDQLEEQKHRARVGLLGSNYLLETYLGQNQTAAEGEDDSGVVTEQPSSENTSTPTEDTKEDEDQTIEEDLETEIEDLQRRIELWEKIVKVNKRLEKEEESVLRLSVAIRRTDEMGELKEELDKVREATDRTNLELERTAATLTEAETALDSRRRHLQLLQLDLEATEGETERLTLTRSKAGEADSNSDTGLSSLHSGSEDGAVPAYSLPRLGRQLLDTLV